MEWLWMVGCKFRWVERLNLPCSLKSVHCWNHCSEWVTSQSAPLDNWISLFVQGLFFLTFNNNCQFDRLAYFFTLSTMPMLWLIKFCTCLWLLELQLSWPHFPPNYGEGTLCQMGNSVWHMILDDEYLISSTNFLFKIQDFPLPFSPYSTRIKFTHFQSVLRSCSSLLWMFDGFYDFWLILMNPSSSKRWRCETAYGTTDLHPLNWAIRSTAETQ